MSASGFLPLILCAIVFVGGHFLLSSLPVRDRLTARLGERLFTLLYATVALASLAGMIWSYSHAPVVTLWPMPRWLAVLPLAVMPFAFWLLIEGLSRPNPTAVGQRVTDPKPKGLFAVTRHPGLWGFALWAAAHMVVNGDVASQILMGSVLVLALGGARHIDVRRRDTLGAAWREYARRTSWLPFLAMAAGRAKLRLGEIGWARPLAALILYGAILHFHSRLFGVSPLP